MPRHDTQREPAEHLSRRSLLQGAATAGAAGLAVTALGGALSPAASAATRAPAATRTPAGHASAPAGAAETAEPIVVHVRNLRTGDIEVFSGTSQTRVRDKDLAARIAGAIG